MIDRLTPHLITLTYDAALKSFWRKEALRKFLRQCRISENFLATWSPGESKREFLDRVFAELQKGPKGRSAILQIAGALQEQESFPDLANWEDSAEKIRDAHIAVARLREYLQNQKEELQGRKDREETRRQYREHLVIELKFTVGQSGAPDIDTFLKKVNDKADNTMGIMVSISGYSYVAKNEASGPRTPLLLLDHSHLYQVLSGVMGMVELIERVRRHASQTGEAYLGPSKFGGE